VPIALLTLVSEDEQWFKSSQGLRAVATPRSISFCGHAILEEDTFVVEDARADSRFSDNPLVLGEPKIRFYAGEPVRRGGQCIGTLCVIDSQPREFPDADRQILKDLACLIEAEFERVHLSETQAEMIAAHDDLKRRASIDGLTRLWNRSAILELLSREVALARRGSELTIAMIDVDNFKLINDTYGHPTGDRVLSEVAARIRSSIRDSDCVGRYGGEEFLAVLGGCLPEDAQASVARILESVSLDPITFKDASIQVTVSVGYASFGKPLRDADSLLAAADAALYRAKTTGRNRASFSRAS